jgi:hypothetical protein
MTEAPLFASSREALTFAANFKGETIKASTMNRMLADMQKTDPEAVSSARKGAPNTMKGLSSLDRAGQAGLIMQLFYRLPDGVIPVALAAVLKPRDVCSCRQPCCQGWRTNKFWFINLAYIDEAVWQWLEDTKPKGKKGAFTLTAPLRAELVRQFFDRSSKQTQADIAERFGLSEEGVASHQRKIGKHLTGLIRDSFSKLDEILVEAGIVGAVE